MTLEFGTPGLLWLFALLPLVWLAGYVGVRARPRAWYSVARLLLLACLIAALAQPVLSVRASRIAVVYLVDASHSVSTRALDTAADAIDGMNAGLRPDVSRILVFGGRVAAVTDTSALRRLAAGETADSIERLVSPSATNLEQALAAARAEIPPSTSGRIVLFSDGHQTDGDSLRIAERLAAEHVPVFTVALPVRDIGDTWIEDVRLPRSAVADAATTVELVVGSQVAQPADIVVRERSRVLARLRAPVAAGESIVRVDVSFAGPGPHLIDAAVTAVRDVLPDNNTLSREVIVAPRPRVLYVHAATDDARAVPLALVQDGFQITAALPQALPGGAEALDNWDVVVLSNVGRTQLSTEAMVALSAWVEERGGGLLFVGGNAVFGEGVADAQLGYRRTEIERVLPVTFDRDDEPEVALVIVLDRSWSMNGAAMELSKTAAEAAAGTLAPMQLLGVLTFNNGTNWDVPLGRVRDSRPTLHGAIAKITASGPTDIYLALGDAYVALAGVRARAKHVILLSDGQSDPQDFEGLVRKMTGAHITVSTVALGPDAGVKLLRNLATWGGGRNYVVQDAAQVPEIFVKEARSAATPGSEEAGGITPTVRQNAVLPEIAAPLPTLQGHNPVTRKPQAIEWLATARNDPLLTVWPAGLGRTAMFAADLDGRWTRDWMRWRGLGSVLGGIVRSLAPRRQPLASLTVTAGERQGSQRQLTVSLDVRDRDGRSQNLLTPAIEVRSATGGRATAGLTQVALGRYETHLVADTTEPLTFSIVNAANGANASRIFAVDQAAEYRFAAPDEARLSAISRATGGTLRPTADDFGRAPRSLGKARYPLAPWLLTLGLALWPVDIALRRFRR